MRIAIALVLLCSCATPDFSSSDPRQEAYIREKQRESEARADAWSKFISTPEGQRWLAKKRAEEDPQTYVSMVKDICRWLRESAMKLKTGMELSAVRKAIGTDPTEFALVTCGVGTAKPWRCLTWQYRIVTPSVSRPYCLLTLTFEEPDREQPVLSNWSFE